MFGVSGYLKQRFSRRSKQNAVDNSLVLQCQRSQSGGQRENDMEVRNRK
jgi:hypothetical protein